MKLFRAFCQGKSILVKDTQKLTKYIDLCLKTPVTYTGIQKSIGYNEIISAQFNSKDFNITLFPQFINLIGRDFKELDSKEFNYFIQALIDDVQRIVKIYWIKIFNFSKLNNYYIINQIKILYCSCYVESATTQKVYDKIIFENVVNQISLNATYVQKSLFFITIFWYIAFYRAIFKSQQVVEKFEDDLFKQIPETAEEYLWRVFIEMHKLQMRRYTKVKDETFKNEEIKIMEKFIEQIEAVDVHLPKFTNIMSRFMLLKYYTVLKYFNVQTQDKKFHNLLFSVYTNSQNYITENLSSLNSFGLYGYIDLIQKDNQIFQSTKWDIILSEINSKNFNEMPIFDILALFFVIVIYKKFQEYYFYISNLSFF